MGSPHPRTPGFDLLNDAIRRHIPDLGTQGMGRGSGLRLWFSDTFTPDMEPNPLADRVISRLGYTHHEGWRGIVAVSAEEPEWEGPVPILPPEVRNIINELTRRADAMTTTSETMIRMLSRSEHPVSTEFVGWLTKRISGPGAIRPVTEDEAVKALALATGRQSLAHSGTGYVPPWEGLNPDEQITAVREALWWLRAAEEAGLLRD